MSSVKERRICHCCFLYTLDLHTYEISRICPVCRWKEDSFQSLYPLEKRGGNSVNLTTARINYIKSGTSKPQLSAISRLPIIEDIYFTSDVNELPAQSLEFSIRKIKTQVLGLARSMSAGSIDVLKGSILIASIAGLLRTDPELTYFMNTFIGISSEIDDLPTNSTRHLWSADALEIKDTERAFYRDQIKDDTKNECLSLIDILTKQLIQHS